MEKIKGVFIDAEVGNSYLRGYRDPQRPTRDEVWRNAQILDGFSKNEKIIESLQRKYEVFVFPTLGDAVRIMTEDEEAGPDISFMITNVPHTDLMSCGGKGEFAAYQKAFEGLRVLREKFPELKIIAYTAAPDNVRKKVYEDKLVHMVRQKGLYKMFGSEMANLVYDVGRAMEGWGGCE